MWCRGGGNEQLQNRVHGVYIRDMLCRSVPLTMPWQQLCSATASCSVGTRLSLRVTVEESKAKAGCCDGDEGFFLRPTMSANNSGEGQLRTTAFAKRSIVESRKQRGGKQSPVFNRRRESSLMHTSCIF